MYDYLVANPVPGDVLVPVPLHRKRLREGSYNQSGMLSQELSKLTSLPVIDDCLGRLRHALPQARTANVSGRQRNVDGAFACGDGRLRGRRVLLIYDVTTSGTTLDACARELKVCGRVFSMGADSGDRDLEAGTENLESIIIGSISRWSCR